MVGPQDRKMQQIKQALLMKGLAENLKIQLWSVKDLVVEARLCNDSLLAMPLGISCEGRVERVTGN